MPRAANRKVELIPIASVNVLNPRERNKRIHREIVGSIEMVGLKRPITVSRHADTDPIRYDLVCVKVDSRRSRCSARRKSQPS